VCHFSGGVPEGPFKLSGAEAPTTFLTAPSKLLSVHLASLLGVSSVDMPAGVPELVSGAKLLRRPSDTSLPELQFCLPVYAPRDGNPLSPGAVPRRASDDVKQAEQSVSPPFTHSAKRRRRRGGTPPPEEPADETGRSLWEFGNDGTIDGLPPLTAGMRAGRGLAWSGEEGQFPSATPSTAYYDDKHPRTPPTSLFDSPASDALFPESANNGKSTGLNGWDLFDDTSLYL
jgi:hypothetical protein